LRTGPDRYAAAKAQLKLAYAEFKRQYPEADPNGGFSAQLLKDSIVSGWRRSLLVLSGVALMATWIPAAPASRLDPMRALREG
jgi:hypothetical protein